MVTVCVNKNKVSKHTRLCYFKDKSNWNEAG